MSSSRDDHDAVTAERPLLPVDKRATNVGILSIAAYFPKTYVSQEDLEKYDKVDTGKYTKGLMQEKMGFCTDLEDINSIALTVTKRLIDASGISLKDIGYLEVGTETILDKSKSVKTVLMELFESSGNSDIEGVDTTNACYGGTAALFHAIDYCSTEYWDGRLAIVVAADIAVYDKGNARPTGGCGAIAMLIGPNAPLVIDRRTSATHVTHTYDFYKPDPSSEYPTVDGKLSLQAYISAIDKCYQKFRSKYLNDNPNKDASKFSVLDEFDGILMHSPYCKLVRKAFARLLFDEFNVIARNSNDPSIKEQERFKSFHEQIPESELTIAYDQWMKLINGKVSIEKVAIQLSEQSYQEKTAGSLFLSNQVGNMYTASLYSCLVSYLTSKPVEKLMSNNLLFFSYGSGSAASMFLGRTSDDIQALRKLIVGIQDVRVRLEERIKVTPEEFTAHLEHRKKTYSLPSRSPTGQPIEALESNGVGQISVESYLFPGTYYLTSVDGMFRRKYLRYEEEEVENNNNNASCVMSKNHLPINNSTDGEQATQVTTA